MKRQRITPERSVWQGMKQRCLYKGAASYKYYGGRGIKVCERWLKFANFLADMGARPPGMTLDRIDSDGDYEPSNCRWATRAEQRRNSSQALTAVTLNGETRCLTDWAELLGIPFPTLHTRLYQYGWPPEKALVKKNYRKRVSP